MSDRNTIVRSLRLPSFAAAILLMMCGTNVYAQTETAPANDLPNPYVTTAPWGTLPAGRTWGALNGVAIDNDGESVWAVSRCGANPDVPAGESPFLYDSCAGSSVPPVMKFDASGKLLTAFGAGMFIFPHKIYIDRDNNVWVIDGRGVNEREALTQPNSIVIAPNGDIFIAEGHGGQTPGAPPETVSRISKFSKDGVFIKSFGKLGAAPGEFKLPHDIAMDSQGRLFVADRGNMRIQILDQEGAFITEWKQFSRPSGIAIRDGMIYVADSESNGVVPHPGWKRGIRIGRVSDGVVLYRIPDPLELKGTSAAEGVAVDAKGNVYGGEVGPRQLVRHAKP